MKMSWFNSPNVSFKLPFKKKSKAALEPDPLPSHTWSHALERQPPTGVPERPKPAEPTPAPMPVEQRRPEPKRRPSRRLDEVQDRQLQPRILEEPMRPRVTDLQHVQRDEDKRRDRFATLQALRTDLRTSGSTSRDVTQSNVVSSSQGLLALKMELGGHAGDSEPSIDDGLQTLRTMRRQLQYDRQVLADEGSVASDTSSVTQLQPAALGGSGGTGTDSLERLRRLRQDLGGASDSEESSRSRPPAYTVQSSRTSSQALLALQAQEVNQEVSLEAIKMKMRANEQSQQYSGHVRVPRGDAELPDSIASELTPSLAEYEKEPPTEAELHEEACQVRHMLLCLALDEGNPIAAQKAARPKRRRTDTAEGEQAEILELWTLILNLQKEVQLGKQEWVVREDFAVEWRPIVWDNIGKSPPEEQAKKETQREDWDKNVERAREDNTEIQTQQRARNRAGVRSSNFLSSLLDIAMPSFMSRKAPPLAAIQEADDQTLHSPHTSPLASPRNAQSSSGG